MPCNKVKCNTQGVRVSQEDWEHNLVWKWSSPHDDGMQCAHVMPNLQLPVFKENWHSRSILLLWVLHDINWNIRGPMPGHPGGKAENAPWIPAVIVYVCIVELCTKPAPSLVADYLEMKLNPPALATNENILSKSIKPTIPRSHPPSHATTKNLGPIQL